MSDIGLSCGISGLPICIGQKVIAFWVTVGPYKDERGYVKPLDGDWFLRTVPMPAVLDEFGRLRGMDPILQGAWVWGLQQDVEERPLGDNRYHDLPVALGLSFEEYAGLVNNGRVFVHNMERLEKLKAERTLEDKGRGRGVPTVAAVKKAIGRTKYPFMISEKGRNCIWVRGDFGVREAQLARAQKKLGAWRTILTSLEHHVSLLVFPATDKTALHELGYYDTAELTIQTTPELLKVALMVIRKDVWDGTAKIGALYPRTNYQRGKDKLVTFKGALTEANKKLKEKEAFVLPGGGPGLNELLYGRFDDWLGGHVPFRLNLHDHMRYLLRTTNATRYFPLWE